MRMCRWYCLINIWSHLLACYLCNVLAICEGLRLHFHCFRLWRHHCATFYLSRRFRPLGLVSFWIVGLIFMELWIVSISLYFYLCFLLFLLMAIWAEGFRKNLYEIFPQLMALGQLEPSLWIFLTPKYCWFQRNLLRYLDLQLKSMKPSSLLNENWWTNPFRWL